MKNEFPIVTLNKMFHVGKIDIKLKNEDSYEGSGLSISPCPDAWCKITRSCVGETHCLEKQNNKFLDYYEMSESNKEKIIRWGVENGYISIKDIFKTPVYTEDDDEPGYFLFETYEEALNEYDEDLEELSAEEFITKDIGYVSTDKMKERTMGDAPLVHSFDLLVTIYSEDVLGVDGVYWDEALDVYILSAPRGVIFNSKLSNWTIREATDEDLAETIDDDECY